MSCAIALDGVDDGEICISLDTWHGYACVEIIGPHVQLHTCDLAFVIRFVTRVRRNVSICSICGGIARVGVDDARWHKKCMALCISTILQLTNSNMKVEKV